MLAEQGADIAVNFRENVAAATDVVDQVIQSGRRAIAVQADVTDEVSVQQMVNRVESELGPVDLLVNNAGIFHFVPHSETTIEIWNETLSINLTGVFLVTWAVKQRMIDRGFGRIVNMSSISALRPRMNAIAYATAKAGLTGFTRSTAEALAPYGLRINAVAPGLIDTEILDGVPQETIDSIVAATPLQRIGRPDDIAEVVRFLLSEESRFITGQTLVASGGRVMLP
jgi:3-oxoacyl-[acyl-carrier protein] reductase